MSDEGPKPMEFAQTSQTGRVAVVRAEEQPTAVTNNVIVREEPALPPEYQFRLRAIDQAGDIVGVLAALIAVLFKVITGEQFVMLVFGVLGVNNGLRQLGSRVRDAAGSIKPPPGLGAITLFVAAAGTAASHFFRAHSGTHAGFARVRTMHAIALATVLVCVAAIAGCASTQHGDSMTQLTNFYSGFRSVMTRVCGVVSILPAAPTATNPPPVDGGVP